MERVPQNGQTLSEKDLILLYFSALGSGDHLSSNFGHNGLILISSQSYNLSIYPEHVHQIAIYMMLIEIAICLSAESRPAFCFSSLTTLSKFS
jgi:hypothetical protein